MAEHDDEHREWWEAVAVFDAARTVFLASWDLDQPAPPVREDRGCALTAVTAEREHSA